MKTYSTYYRPIPFKYLSDFWRSLDLPLINCEEELDLVLTANCVFTENDNNSRNAKLKKSTKLYIPVVILSINDNIHFLENLKQVFSRTMSWNKCRSETTIQPKYNNFIFDLTFLIGY